MSIFKEEKWNSPNGYHISMLSCVEETDESILLCVRGFGGGKYSLIIEEIAETIKPAGAGTISFTWPAHGDSDADGDMLLFDNCMRDLETVVSRIRRQWPQKKLYCLATSFGGYMTVHYHSRHPEEFAHIILRSPAVQMADVVWSFLDEDQKRRAQSGEKLDFGFGENVLRLGISFYDSLKAHPIEDAAVAVPEKFSIIQGDQDEVVPPEDVRIFAEHNHIPIWWVEGADHQYRNPGGKEQVIAYIRQFFA